MPKGADRMRRRVRAGTWYLRKNSGMFEIPLTQLHAHRESDPIMSSTMNLQTAMAVEETYNEEELEELRQLFNFFDADGSGAIGSEELKKAILNFGHHATDAEIDQLIREVDENGDGEISFEEFCHCLRRSKEMTLASNEEFVRQCFDVFDQDKNGVITAQEFVYIAKEIGGFCDELAEFIFDQLDVSSTGYLNADQFAAICADYMLND